MNPNSIELPAGDWTLFDAPRVPPGSKSALSRVARGVLWMIRRETRESEDFNVFLVLARLGRLFPGHSVFVSQLLGKTRLSTPEKELVVVRVAWRLGCAYEYAHHYRSAVAANVSETHLRAATTENPTGLDPRTTALLHAADELVRHHKLDDDGWAALTTHVDADTALELCMFVGHYIMIAGIINTAGVQPEPHYAVHRSPA